MSTAEGLSAGGEGLSDRSGGMLMALAPCRQCGKSVATDAPTCPGCGTPNPVPPEFPEKRDALPAALQFLGIIVLGGLGVLLVAVWVINALSPAPPPTQPTQPAVAVSAEQLFADYHGNEVAADSKYKGRVLSLTGVVEGINKGFLGKTYLTLATTNMFLPVHADLKSSEVPRAAGVVKGERVQLVCKGKGMIIGSPMVDECYFP